MSFLICGNLFNGLRSKKAFVQYRDIPAMEVNCQNI